MTEEFIAQYTRKKQPEKAKKAAKAT
jgi:hypothetical protein